MSGWYTRWDPVTTRKGNGAPSRSREPMRASLPRAEGSAGEG